MAARYFARFNNHERDEAAKQAELGGIRCGLARKKVERIDCHVGRGIEMNMLSAVHVAEHAVCPTLVHDDDNGIERQKMAQPSNREVRLAAAGLAHHHGVP